MLEVVIAVAIIGVLASIAFPAFKGVESHAAKVQCIGNLHTIHAGFDGYLLERNSWPQLPNGALYWDESQFFGWFVATLEPYGVGEYSWLCKADKAVRQSRTGEEFAGSYVPTLFDAHHFTPYKWSQPWVIERGDFHGRGAHILMPDGSIHPSTNPFGG